MSFDLYAFDPEGAPHSLDEVADVLDDDTRWDAPLAPALADLVAELERRFPGLDDDPDRSPWASWPLDQSVASGHGCAFNISWSHADPVAAVVRELCAERGLTLYDPQEDRLVPPGDDGAAPDATTDAGRAPRRWWRRR